LFPQVNPAVVRSVNAKQADMAAAAEQEEQVASPRRPSQDVANLKNAVNEVVMRRGGSRRASTEMKAEQVSRIQQHTFETEVGPSLVRAVNVATADAAAALEQCQRIAEHLIRTEVNPAVVRSVNAKLADTAAAAEQEEQVASPRRPSQDIAKLKDLVNASIEGDLVVVDRSG
jgi:hypothetical protein